MRPKKLRKSKNHELFHNNFGMILRYNVQIQFINLSQ